MKFVRSIAWSCRGLLILGSLSISACGDEPFPLNALPPDAVILAFGNSLTSGTGAFEAQSYPAQLEVLIGRTVRNAGVSGEVTAKGIERLSEELAQHGPHLVILIHGGNDMLRHLPASQIKQNISDMINLAKQSGADVVLIGVPEPRIFPVRVAQLYEEIAEEWHVAYDNQIMGEILSSPTLKSDAVHPNNKGYYRLASRIVEILRAGGAL